MRGILTLYPREALRSRLDVVVRLVNLPVALDPGFTETPPVDCIDKHLRFVAGEQSWLILMQAFGVPCSLVQTNIRPLSHVCSGLHFDRIRRPFLPSHRLTGGIKYE